MKDITAPEKHSVIAVGPNIWGKGKTLREAVTQARKFGPMKEGRYSAYVVPEDSICDEMAYIERHRDCKDCQQIVFLA